MAEVISELLDKWMQFLAIMHTNDSTVLDQKRELKRVCRDTPERLLALPNCNQNTRIAEFIAQLGRKQLSYEAQLQFSKLKREWNDYTSAMTQGYRRTKSSTSADMNLDVWLNKITFATAFNNEFSDKWLGGAEFSESFQLIQSLHQYFTVGESAVNGKRKRNGDEEDDERDFLPLRNRLAANEGLRDACGVYKQNMITTFKTMMEANAYNTTMNAKKESIQTFVRQLNVEIKHLKSDPIPIEADRSPVYETNCKAILIKALSSWIEGFEVGEDHDEMMQKLTDMCQQSADGIKTLQADMNNLVQMERKLLKQRIESRQANAQAQVTRLVKELSDTGEKELTREMIPHLYMRFEYNYDNSDDVTEKAFESMQKKVDTQCAVADCTSYVEYLIAVVSGFQEKHEMDKALSFLQKQLGDMKERIEKHRDVLLDAHAITIQQKVSMLAKIYAETRAEVQAMAEKAEIWIRDRFITPATAIEARYKPKSEPATPVPPLMTDDLGKHNVDIDDIKPLRRYAHAQFQMCLRHITEAKDKISREKQDKLNVWLQKVLTWLDDDAILPLKVHWDGVTNLAVALQHALTY